MLGVRIGMIDVGMIAFVASLVAKEVVTPRNGAIVVAVAAFLMSVSLSQKHPTPALLASSVCVPVL